jgi:anti-sigma B factor antagonist
MPSDSTPIAGSLRPRGPVVFDVHRRSTPEATLLEVAGEVDLLTAATLGHHIDDEVRRGQDDLVIDLTATQFVDSAGLHILLNAQRRLTRRGRRLAIICQAGPVRRVFELARLIDTLRVFGSLREYREAAASRAAALRPPGRARA